MTQVRINKTGQIGCLVGIMANPNVKGGCGNRATALVAINPKSTNDVTSHGLRYVLRSVELKSITFLDPFPWESANCEHDGQSSNIPKRKKDFTNKALAARWQASKEFAMMQHLAPVRTNTICPKKYVKSGGK